jgi:hypothetical protein
VALAALLAAGAAGARPPTKSECIAANESAQDLVRAGKLHDARTRLAACVSTSCPAAVREDCAGRLQTVESRMPSLVFDVKDAAGNDVPGVRLGVDGASVQDALNGTPVEIDPGQHALTFDADGLPQGHRTLVVAEGDKARRVHVVLGDPKAEGAAEAASRAGADGSATPGAVASSAGAEKAPGEKEPAEKDASAHDPDAGGGQRTAGWVLAGAGVVGLAVGGVFGLTSKSTYDHALQTECGGDPNGCTPQGKQDGQSAHSQALVSTVAFAAGAAALAAGAVLYFTAPKSGVTVGAGAAPGVASLQLVGRW